MARPRLRAGKRTTLFVIISSGFPSEPSGVLLQGVLKLLREVRYRIADPEIVVACGIVHAVLERRFGRLAGLASATVPTARTLEPSAIPTR